MYIGAKYPLNLENVNVTNSSPQHNAEAITEKELEEAKAAWVSGLKELQSLKKESYPMYSFSLLGFSVIKSIIL